MATPALMLRVVSLDSVGGAGADLDGCRYFLWACLDLPPYSMLA